jgi:hypothetical protein
MALLFVVLAELCRAALPAPAPAPVPRSRPSTVAAGV